MRKFKKAMYLLTIFTLIFLCTGCARIDFDIKINTDETGLINTKISIEESVYEMLQSTGSFEVENDSEDPINIKDLKKEEINGVSYYYTEKIKEFNSYEAMVNLLKEIEVSEGVNIFENVEIEKVGMKYIFRFKTAIITEDVVSPFPEDKKNRDWLIVTLSVDMPGVIKETNGVKVRMNTVCFTLNDFTASSEHYVQSAIPLSETIMITAFATGAVIALLYVLDCNKKRKEKEIEPENIKDQSSENENIAEEDEEMETYAPLESFEEYKEIETEKEKTKEF